MLLNRNKINSLENWLKYGFPADAVAPIILKNEFNVNVINCSDNDFLTNFCMNSVRQRTINLFGDRNVLIHKFYVNKNGEYYGDNFFDNITLTDYLNNDTYSKSTYFAVFGVGNHSEYNNFVGINNLGYNTINNALYNNKYINTLYQGTVYFMARGVGTGTGLHFSWSKTLFFMLGGKKRWILLNPNKFNKVQCKVAYDAALLGFCGHHSKPEISEMSMININKYISEYNLSKENNDYIDIIVGPGDIILTPDLWIHATENLTPETYAFSMRFWSQRYSDNYLASTKLNYSFIFNMYLKTIISSFKLNSFKTLYTMFYTEFFKGPYDEFDTDKAQPSYLIQID